MNPVILSNKDKKFDREELEKYTKRSNYLQEDFDTFCKEVLEDRYYRILKGERNVVDEDFFNSEWALDRRDNRTALEFAKSLILNKAFEEFNRRYFNLIYNSGLEYTATEGTDILETNNEISNYPDFKSRKGCLVEFIKLENGYWCKKEKAYILDIIKSRN